MVDALSKYATQAAALDSMKSELGKVSRELQKMRTEKFNLEAAIVKAARASFSTLPPAPAPAPKTDPRSHSEEVAVVMAADWQLGKVTPNYNSDVTADRVQQVARKVASITEVQRSDHPVKRCHLWLLGDLVEGELIFPGQEHHIDSSLIDQVFTTGSTILRDLVYGLLGTFETVTVMGVIGNHGRIGGLKSGVYHPNTNSDRMLYMVAREWFRATKEARVSWTIPVANAGDRGWYTVDNIGRYSSLLIHGDQFRGGNSFAGLPYFSFAKKTLLWRDMSMIGDMPKFKDVACGHWHRNARVPVGTTEIRVAGTTESHNPWSIETLAATSAPSQHLMFVHPKDGIVTAEYRLDLT